MKKSTLFFQHIFIASILAVAVVFSTVSGYAQTNEGEKNQLPNGAYSVVSFAKSLDNKDQIFGRFYYPANFDSQKQYTTVVMAHGGNITSDIYNTYYAPAMAAAGYVCYSYDVRGVKSQFGGANGGSRSTNNAGKSPSLDTYLEDCNAALDYVLSKNYVSKENVYLWGQSMGGITAQLVAQARPKDLRGIVILYGSIGNDNSNAFSGDNIKSMLAKPYSGETLFIQGNDDFAYTRSYNNLKNYPNWTFVDISDAGHGFGYMPDRAAKICTQNVINFIERVDKIRVATPGMQGSVYATVESVPVTKQADVLTEGYTVKGAVDGNGFISVVTKVSSRDGKDQLFGRFYYPADFDATKKYPTIIMMHGANITSDIYNSFYGPYFASKGYVCYAVDVRGVTSQYGGNSRSTNNAAFGNMSFIAYEADHGAAVDFALTKNFVDAKNIYIMGQSMGGGAVQLLLSQKHYSDIVKGAILLYTNVPGEQMIGGYLKTTDFKSVDDFYTTVRSFKGEVLAITGHADDAIKYEAAFQSGAQFNKHTTWSFIDISGAGHGFGYMPDRAAVTCAQAVVDYIHAWEFVK